MSDKENIWESLLDWAGILTIITIALLSGCDINAQVRPTYTTEPITHQVPHCPAGMHLESWHEHVEWNTPTAVTTEYRIPPPDKASGYYPVEAESVPYIPSHPDNCTLRAEPQKPVTPAPACLPVGTICTRKDQTVTPPLGGGGGGIESQMATHDMPLKAPVAGIDAKPELGKINFEILGAYIKDGHGNAIVNEQGYHETLDRIRDLEREKDALLRTIDDQVKAWAESDREVIKLRHELYVCGWKTAHKETFLQQRSHSASTSESRKK